MRVDHLYVLAIYAALDTEQDKKLETKSTAKALFARHGQKARDAVLADVNSFDASYKIVEELKKQPQIGLPSDKSEMDGKEKDPQSTQLQKPTAGLYIVFHSDGGGMSVDPAVVATVIAKLVPENLHAAISKVSLFACCIADRGDGAPINKMIGLTPEEVRWKAKPTGGLEVMVGLLGEFGKLGIRPMICGYDIPVYAGEGPYKQGKPARKVKVLNEKGGWQNSTYDNPDVYGRKLAVYNDKRQSLGTLKGRYTLDDTYKNAHKKVLRLNDEGKICEALAGWSSRD